MKARRSGGRILVNKRLNTPLGGRFSVGARRCRMRIGVVERSRPGVWAGACDPPHQGRSRPGPTPRVRYGLPGARGIRSAVRARCSRRTGMAGTSRKRTNYPAFIPGATLQRFCQSRKSLNKASRSCDVSGELLPRCARKLSNLARVCLSSEAAKRASISVAIG